MHKTHTQSNIHSFYLRISVIDLGELLLVKECCTLQCMSQMPVFPLRLVCLPKHLPPGVHAAQQSGFRLQPKQQQIEKQQDLLIHNDTRFLQNKNTLIIMKKIKEKNNSFVLGGSEVLSKCSKTKISDENESSAERIVTLGINVVFVMGLEQIVL